LARKKSNGGASGSRLPASGSPTVRARPEGHDGWDDYAPFYDWENARSMGRRDLPFWRTVAQQVGGPVLELGCGTGRLSIPLARAGVPIVGIDRSEPMLARARRRASRAGLAARLPLIRGDIRFLPFAAGRRRVAPFAMVLAPYGMLQSLLRERDLMATLAAAHRVLEPGGMLGIELVADLPSWAEYKKRVSLSGWRGRTGGSRVSLVESVRQDRARRLTIFDQEFTERRGRSKTVRTFSLAFRTLSVPQMVKRLEASGFEISALLGDYKGRAWDPRADAWVILAKKPPVVGR
jgi:SAM-dependent methyltransferase